MTRMETDRRNPIARHLPLLPAPPKSRHGNLRPVHRIHFRDSQEKLHGAKGPRFSVKGILYDIYRGTMLSALTLAISPFLTVGLLVAMVAACCASDHLLLRYDRYPSVFCRSGFHDPRHGTSKDGHPKQPRPSATGTNGTPWVTEQASY